MIRLTAVIEVEGQAPRALTHESNNRTIVLGRDATADFQIPLSTISRQHTRIQETDGVYVIEDLGSTHGTLVNGRKIGKGEKKVLRDGDVVELTKAKLTCHIETDRPVTVEAGEGTQAIAARAVQGILGRLGDGGDNGPYLRVLNGADDGVRFLLGGTLTEWTLGRSKDCEFILNDPNVSRRHATVKKDWNGFTIYDLGSKNGVQINERQVGRPARLKDRDEITIGPVKLVFIDPDAELLAALQDVPGFEQPDPVGPEAMEGDPSCLGVPADASQSDEDGANEGGEAQEQGLEGGAAVAPAEDEDEAEDEGVPRPMQAMDTDFENIDPLLLEQEKSGRSIEWIIIGVVAVVVVISVGLLFLII